MADTTIPLPTAEQEQRAKWDLLLADPEHRAKETRQMKAYDGPWVWVQAIIAAAAVFAARGVVGGLFVTLLRHG